MALPKEPRQKMINLMYLVLTALLALNVSAEILNAFKTVDNSLNKTNTAINTSTTNVMESFKIKLSDPKTHDKAATWMPKAEAAQKLTTDLYNYIESLRDQIRKEAVINKDGSIQKEDNQDIATRLMIKEGKGKELQGKLAKYKADMISLIANDASLSAEDKAKHTSEFKRLLQVDEAAPTGLQGGDKTFENAYFHMVPTVAALTILRKFENDVKTSENRVVNYLHEQVGKVEVIFDSFEAIVGQNSKYLMPGQELEITAGLGAFSKTKVPDIYIGGAKIATNEKGMALHKIPAGAIGAHTIPVKVAFLDQDGKPQERTFNVEYTVGSANASIALDKMNVLYIGVNNPVTIAASGGGDDKTQVSISGGGGSITRTGTGKYNVRVSSQTDECVITVNVDGKIAGSSRFRVRSIPTPAAFVGGQPSGATVSAGALASQAGVQAGIKDFPFDLTYNVVEYTVSGLDDEGNVVKASGNGAAFTDQARKIIRMAKPGDLLQVGNIYCVGDDGVRRKLPSLVYNIN